MSKISTLKNFSNASIESLDQSGNCFETSFRSFDNLTSQTCDAYITSCDSVYNIVTITNFVKIQKDSFFEYTISYCCNSLGEQAGYCSLFWHANCELSPVVSAPETKCVGSSSEFSGSGDYVTIFDSWFYNDLNSRLEYHTNKGLCVNGCLNPNSYTPNFTPVLDRSDILRCQPPPYTPTTTPTQTPVSHFDFSLMGFNIHSGVRFAGDKPLPSECCMTAISNVTEKPNLSDQSSRVFYKTTENNLFFDQIGTLCELDNDGTLIEDYATNFKILPGDQPTTSNFKIYSGPTDVVIAASTPIDTNSFYTESFDYVSIVSAAGSTPPTPTESATVKINDLSLIKKTFTFSELSSIESSGANLAELNSSYWLNSLPELIYQTSDFSQIDSQFLPKIFVHNATNTLENCNFNLSGKGSLEENGSTISFQRDYSNNNSDVFISLRSMPYNFLSSRKFLAITELDSIYNVENLVRSRFLSIDLEYQFEIEDSIYNSEKNDRLSFCSSKIINRREIIKLFLNPFQGNFNIINGYEYPNAYGIDVTSPLSHSTSLITGFSHRLA